MKRNKLIKIVGFVFVLLLSTAVSSYANKYAGRRAYSDREGNRFDNHLIIVFAETESVGDRGSIGWTFAPGSKQVINSMYLEVEISKLERHRARIAEEVGDLADELYPIETEKRDDGTLDRFHALSQRLNDLEYSLRIRRLELEEVRAGKDYRSHKEDYNSCLEDPMYSRDEF